MPSCTSPGGAIFRRISKCARLMRRRHQRGCSGWRIVDSAQADATMTASGCQTAPIRISTCWPPLSSQWLLTPGLCMRGSARAMRWTQEARTAIPIIMMFPTVNPAIELVFIQVASFLALWIRGRGTPMQMPRRRTPAIAVPHLRACQVSKLQQDGATRYETTHQTDKGPMPEQEMSSLPPLATWQLLTKPIKADRPRKNA